MADIAVVGMSCRYADTRSPHELWENVLAGRQAFRRYPSERLRIEDYFCQDTTQPDSTYASQGAFIENYEFDRIKFRISGSSYRASDLAHWLALDIASQALIDAGFTAVIDLPASTTAVIVGNTLTGEFSRAHGLRLRWPYVRRIVGAALCQQGWTDEQCHPFLKQLEAAYKEPFAPVGEETLAGGLSNTIAGRICNYFDLKGGGYTVDGACASSLLAITTACSQLAAGEIDLGIAGGVDLSLDPFELVGFAKTAALTADEMRIYDRRSSGFIPGEGCGFVVLMRYEDALAQQRRVYAIVRGWGISSDGSGAITRPEVEGQMLALHRAYQKAGIGIESVAYFEGHGTGTSVGDSTELQTISRALRQGPAAALPATIGSVKANIGHTKAASGVAGFIKATMALYTQIIPPTSGTHHPHDELTKGGQAVLTVRNTGIVWPPQLALRAGVSAMGFGGINTHLVLEGLSSRRRSTLSQKERVLLSSAQDGELILLCGQTRSDLQQQVMHLLTFAARLSRAEVTDLALHLMRAQRDAPVRAAVVVSSARELAHSLERLQSLLAQGDLLALEGKDGIFFGAGDSPPRIGFLFPGQGSPGHLQGGLLRRTFSFIDDLYTDASLPTTSDEKDTIVAQPAIVTASLAALLTLKRLGIHADVAIGHSLGELTALHWAGAFDQSTLLTLAAARGRAMAAGARSNGTMVSILAGREIVEALLQGSEAVIAGVNTPIQTIVAGTHEAINAISARASAKGVSVVPLKVSHAFHSPLIAPAVPLFEKHLESLKFEVLHTSIISTVTGEPLEPTSNLKHLLCQQMTAPVQFVAAMSHISQQVDILLEVGPGKVLSGLAAECTSVPAIALDAGGPSLKGLLQAVAALFALGVPLNLTSLWENRFARPFDLNWQPRFFANPCEQAPLPGATTPFVQEGGQAGPEESVLPEATTPISSARELVRQLVAGRAELPLHAVGEASHMLSDLHLNSITVGQIVSEAARTLGLLPPIAPTEYANATVAEIALALEELQQTGGTFDLEAQMKLPSGIDTWIRSFLVEYRESHLTSDSQQPGKQSRSDWHVLAPPDYPFAEDLRRACTQLVGTGTLVCLPPGLSEGYLPHLLSGAHQVLERDTASYLVIVQHGSGGAGIARTLSLEAPQHTVCVVDLPLAHPQTVNWILSEIRAARGYSEAVYDAHGTRRVPILQYFPLTSETESSVSLNADDVLLVTGGGKGIAAECALSLAQRTGIKLALLGRSDPSTDHELAENLKRLIAAQINFRYIRADVTSAEEVQQAIDEIEQELGIITALLHGAGKNTPRLLKTLSEEELLQTIAPKVNGLEHILSRIAPEKLRLLVTFGSVIARTGMRGEADYALANDWLAEYTQRFQATYPACRCLCLEWSVWSGVGMGERLGRIEALIREGITPIQPDQGVAYFQRLLHHHLPDVRVIVTGRVGTIPTLQSPSPQLPFLRFLELPRIYYPEIELVVDVEISTATDLYLEDHKFRGERLLPAVVGLEAMAQVAVALSGQMQRPHFEKIHLERPIVIPERAPLKLRLVALRSEMGSIEIAVRSEETAFQIDHFRAVCRFTQEPHERLDSLSDLPGPGTELLQLNPAHDLYGSILFHQGRFQRLGGYIHLRATECVAEIIPSTGGNLFAHYLPSTLILGDFIARDAVIHAIQPCIPHARLLPIAVEEITFTNKSQPSSQRQFVYAREKARNGDIFTYDVEVCTAQGDLLEQWRGLQLRQVEAISMKGTWNEVLFRPYIERKISEFFPDAPLHLIFQYSKQEERQARSDLILQSLLETSASVHRRPDGKPTMMELPGLTLSTSHQHQFTLAIASSRPIGCDIEAITHRSAEVWQDLLGSKRSQLVSFLTADSNEDVDIAATRLWAASECLKKAGALLTLPLRFSKRYDDGWTLLTAGTFLIATYATGIPVGEGHLVLAICQGMGTEEEQEGIHTKPKRKGVALSPLS